MTFFDIVMCVAFICILLVPLVFGLTSIFKKG